MERIVHAAATLLYLPILIRASANCGATEFPFIYQGNCSSETCPGYCLEQKCCVPQCFDQSEIFRISKECMSHNNTGTCSGFEAEIMCAVDLFNSSVEICEQQVALLASANVLTGEFNPRHCPCENGFVKFVGADPAIQDVCQPAGLCYNVTDDITNVMTYCLSPTMMPKQSSCEDHEQLDDKVILLTMDECAFSCDGTCRDGGAGKLPACCNLQSTHTPIPPPEDEESRVLHVGFIILIVVVVIILFVVALFGWLYMSRYRKIITKQKRTDNFTDLEAENDMSAL